MNISAVFSPVSSLRKKETLAMFVRLPFVAWIVLMVLFWMAPPASAQFPQFPNRFFDDRNSIDNDLTNSANWLDGLLPTSADYAEIRQSVRPTLVLNSDFVTRRARWYLSPGNWTLDLNGNSISGAIDSDGFISFSANTVVKNGIVKGFIAPQNPMTFENIVLAPDSGIAGYRPVLKGVTGTGRTVGESINTVLHAIFVTDQSNFSVEQIGNDSTGEVDRGLDVQGQSIVKVNQLKIPDLNVSDGSTVEAEFWNGTRVTVDGIGSKATLNKYVFGVNVPSTFDVKNGGSLTIGQGPDGFNSWRNIFARFTVTGEDSHLTLLGGELPSWEINSRSFFGDRGGFNNRFISEITDGAVVTSEVPLSLRGYSAQPVTLSIREATFEGDLLAVWSTISLVDGLVKGSSTLLSNASIEGNGRFEGNLLAGPQNTAIRPDGLLRFDGDLLSSVNIFLDFFSSGQFDRIEFGGALRQSPAIQLLFDPSFKGSVGARFDFLKVEDGLFRTPAFPVISFANVPAGYSFRTVTTSTTLGIEITAVPEISSCLLAGCLVTGTLGGRLAFRRVLRRRDATSPGLARR
jgi:hypothetical protein